MAEETSGAEAPTVKVFTKAMVRTTKADRMVAIRDRIQKTTEGEAVP